MKLAIINGDDFGLSPEVNAGIVRAHRDGVLNSASLMVAAPAYDEAAAFARANRSLDVGLHLTLCKGMSVLPPQRLHGLVDAAGRFVESPVLAGLRYFFRRSIRGKLRDECRAQIERHLELVGYLNHIDGHLNFHMHPTIADIVIDLAAEYRVPCIRIPREPVFATLRLERDHAARKLIEAVIFRSLSARARRIARARGVRSTDWLFGLHQSGNLSERYVTGVISTLRDGITEIYFHPAASIGAAPALAVQREVEILTSAAMRGALQANAVQLATFAELARQ